MVETDELFSMLAQERFVEVLYFASLATQVSDSAENQLAFGLSCCAVIQPIADYLRNRDGEHSREPGFCIPRTTKMVANGYLHLESAVKRSNSLETPSIVHSFCDSVRNDLIVYAFEDHPIGIQNEFPFSYPVAAWGAVAIIDRLGVPAKSDHYRDFYPYQFSVKFVEERLKDGLP
ncbi:MAG: hypothetical protein AAFX06_31435 [Planctomycetota bacterium]